MNTKQALRACSRRLIETEAVLARAQSDIRDYNLCIGSMIAGGSPCDWCEEQAECQLTAKADGKGCAEWWLRFKREDAADESEGILPDGGESREQTQDPTGQIEAF